MRKRYQITATCYDRRGRIISKATNDYKRTHPVQAMFARMVGLNEKQFLHAEIAALLKSRDREVYRIVVERYDAFGNPKTAKPCPVCERAIQEWGVKRVEYTVG